MVSVVGQRLSPEHKVLFRRVDELLHYVWDPFGVAGTPEARDEYQSYAPHVFSLLVRDAPAAEIIQYLFTIETENMGLSDTEPARRRAAEVAEILERWRDWIRERPPTI
jgi:hypothetical protein